MKKLLFLFASFILSMQSRSQILEWANGIGSITGDKGRSVVVDAAGNSYVTGSFSGTMDFDPSANIATQNCSGNSDVFVVKFDNQGVYQWAIKMGGTGTDEGHDIAVDANGDVYVTGYFNATVDFDPSGSTANLTAGAFDDAFVAKYTAGGGYQWAFKIGAVGYSYGESICVDPMGDIIVTGDYSQTVDFDPSGNTANLSSFANTQDFFVAKYSNAGVYQWAFSAGESYMDGCPGVCTDALGNIFITGNFYGPVDFDPSGSTATVTSTSTTDIFVAKYNSSGAYQWAFKLGSSQYNYGRSINADGAGDIVVTGEFYGTVDFDPSVNVVNLTASGVQNDAYVAKYNTNGDYQWAFNLGGNAVSDAGYGITTDAANDIIVTGFFGASADFDPGNGTAVLNALSADIFVAKYSSSGAYQWAFGAGYLNQDWGHAVAVDGNGYVYATGYFQDSTDFDPTIDSMKLGSNGVYDVFVAKYSHPTTGAQPGRIEQAALLYPNPLSDQAVLEFPVLRDVASLNLYNSKGELVKVIAGIAGSRASMDRHGLPDGLYYYILQTGEQVITSGKIVVGK